MTPTRRDMVTALLSSLLVGCRKDDDGTDTFDTSLDDCPASLVGAEFDTVLNFVGEPDRVLEVVTGNGLDRRYVTDLSTLDPSSLLLPQERFYIRTGEPDLIDITNWSIDVQGLATAGSFTLADHSDLVEETGPVHLECSGNGNAGGYGLMSAAEFSGIPIAALFARLGIQSAATRVLVEGFDQHSQNSTGSQEGAAWIFPLAEIEEGWLVTHMNGEPLSADHGFPVRLLIPHWWGCASIKWVNSLNFVDETATATSQMQEFAGRTHQSGTPNLARDYIPAMRDPTGAPVRLERWLDGDEVVHRIIGIYWGPAVDESLWEIQIGNGPWQAMTFCVPRTTENTWGLWEKVVRGITGEQIVGLRLSDSTIQTRRLDSGWYFRTGQFV